MQSMVLGTPDCYNKWLLHFDYARQVVPVSFCCRYKKKRPIRDGYINVDHPKP